MKRNLTDGLMLRKDGRYQRKEQIGDSWKTFTARTPEEVWKKIEDAKEEQEEKNGKKKPRRTPGRCSVRLRRSISVLSLV